MTSSVHWRSWHFQCATRDFQSAGFQASDLFNFSENEHATMDLSPITFEDLAMHLNNTGA